MDPGWPTLQQGHQQGPKLSVLSRGTLPAQMNGEAGMTGWWQLEQGWSCVSPGWGEEHKDPEVTTREALCDWRLFCRA